MITCKYCGTELKFLGEYKHEKHFHCNFCDLTFTLSETSFDRKRKSSVPEYLDSDMYLPVKELLKKDTITLLYTLKEARSFWFHIKKLLEDVKLHFKENELPQPINDNADTDLKEQFNSIKREFVHITKQKFAIENIILERTGFLPEKITEDFINGVMYAGEVASAKPMYIYIK